MCEVVFLCCWRYMQFILCRYHFLRLVLPALQLKNKDSVMKELTSFESQCVNGGVIPLAVMGVAQAYAAAGGVMSFTAFLIKKR